MCERGKVRPIDAPHVSDRQIHKTLCNEALVPLYSPGMIYDNGARYEDTDGSAEDLSRDDMVLVWGTCKAGQTTIQADQIQINRFVR